MRAVLTNDVRAFGVRQRDAASTPESLLRINEALVSFSAPDSLEAEQYRTLRHIVERLAGEQHAQVFAVTSPGASEGKTVTTLNLAGSLAQSPGARVLIIDADLHRPQVANYLGQAHARAAGLAEAVMHEDYGFARTVRRLESLNLSVMLAGGGTVGTYELLTSPRLEQVLNEARQQFDYVLLDTPPLLPVADSRLIARLVDGYVVVVAANQTRRKAVNEALGMIDAAKIVAVVFNRDDGRSSSYYGYYGYGDRARARARVSSQPAPRASSWWSRLLSGDR
jgi:capsular exopolysaccharide synthesis family protein